MTTVTANGNTYSDDGTAARDMRDGGHRTWFFPLIQDVLSVIAAQGVGVSGNSTTSLTIGTGSKSLTIESDKDFVAGHEVRIGSTAAPNADYMDGTVTSYNRTTGALVVDVTETGGSGTLASWSVRIYAPAAPPSITRTARTSNTQLTADEAGQFIDVTSGTFSQTFAAVADLGAGWWCYIRNAGTGDITLDPNGSETIDSLTSFVMYPGEVRLVHCDGSVLRSLMLQPGTRVYTSTDTWVKPPGASVVEVDVYGAGGGGGSGNTSGGGGGGGGGAYNRRAFRASELSATVVCTVGAVGPGGTAGGNGTAGGDSDFGTLVYAYGGGPGAGGSSRTGGGGGGTLGAGAAASAGQPVVSGGTVGAFGGGASASSGSTGNASGWGGGGGGGGATTGGNGPGGTSSHGGPGGGGGGGTTGGSGAAGGSAAGGSGGGGAGGATGVAGTAGATSTTGAGTAGGGGGGNGSGTGGAGSAGGAPAAAGGGGGGCSSGTSAGGAGARGEIRVRWW